MSYTIFEDRNGNHEPINLHDSGFELFFWMSDADGSPELLNPSIGSFMLTIADIEYDIVTDKKLKL